MFKGYLPPQTPSKQRPNAYLAVLYMAPLWERLLKVIYLYIPPASSGQMLILLFLYSAPLGEILKGYPPPQTLSKQRPNAHLAFLANFRIHMQRFLYQRIF